MLQNQWKKTHAAIVIVAIVINDKCEARFLIIADNLVDAVKLNKKKVSPNSSIKQTWIIKNALLTSVVVCKNHKERKNVIRGEFIC